MRRPTGSEASEVETRAALETFWGQNYYAQLEFLNCHVLNEDEIRNGNTKEAELRFDFIKPDDKPMVIIWDNEEECLFIDPAPIPMPLYRPRFGADYPKSLGHRVQFSLQKFGEPWDNNYIYSTERLRKMKGGKLRVFRHNVNKFNDEHGDYFKLLHDFRQIIHFIKGMKNSSTSPIYDVNTFMKDCARVIDENIKKDVPWTDELISKFLLWSIVQETSMSQTGDEYIYNVVHGNSRYQIGIMEGKIVSIDIGMKLGPTVLGHYVGKYDKDVKYLIDAARYSFYESAREHGYLYINDGSDLDNPGLRQLKRKFHPVKVINLYDYEPEVSNGANGEGD